MNNHEIHSVKIDLFKDYPEVSIIKRQKISKQDTQLFSQPLSSLFGFYQANYYVIEQNGTMNLHLILKVPISQEELTILKARLQVVFNKKFKRFNIYQEPNSSIKADVWLGQRKVFETTNVDTNEDIKGAIIRKIGQIAQFNSDEVDYHLPKNTKSEPDEPKQVSAQEQLKDLLHKILANKIKGNNFADFTINKVNVKKDSQGNGFNIYVYIETRDDRIFDFFSDEENTKGIGEQIFDKVNSLEIIDEKMLKG